MKVTQKKLGEDRVRLDVVATVDEVAKALHIAQVNFAQSMGLTPQKDRTVAQVAEEKMGIKNLDSIVAGDAVKALVPFALDKKNLAPLFPPEPQPTSPFERGRQFSFTLEVALKPRYELSSYEPVAFSAPKFEANPALVDEQIQQMAKNYISYASAEAKAIEVGDSCLIAMECFEDGKRLDNLCTDGRTFVAGQGYMPEGFEKAILGMKPGDTKTFTFEGPSFDEDFNPTTQTVDCTLTIKEIQQAVEPKLDDEWVQKNMPWYKTFDELRSDIARSVGKQEREQYDNYLRQAAAAEAAKRFQGKIADEAYEATRSNLVDNMRHELQGQGKTWEEFVEENGGEQQLGMMLMLQTREVLVQGFALDAVFRHEKLTLTDADIEEACASINPQMNPKQIRQQFEQSGRGFALRESAERLKANKWLVDHADITYVDQAQPVQGAAEQPAE